jgi:hypothetical protein
MAITKLSSSMVARKTKENDMRLALFVVILTASLAQGQTFKETLRWMHNASEYNSSYDSTKNGLDATEVPLANTCTTFVIIQKHTGDYGHTFKVVLDLRTIDPTKVYAELVEGKPWSYVWIGTTNDEETIQAEDLTSQTDRKTTGTALNFGGKDFAPRFAKALKHAVTLCGGKPSAF